MLPLSPALDSQLDQHPYPLLFAALGGAHLEGYPSPDSDYEVRGMHLLPLAELLGLDAPPTTYQALSTAGVVQIDLKTHDAVAYLGLLLKRNGQVLEQVSSPWVLQSTPWHEELRTLAPDCITRQHAHYYLSAARSHWQRFLWETPHRLGPLLHSYRLLLTGVHLMQSGQVEADLNTLQAIFHLPYLPELIAQKRAGSEADAALELSIDFHTAETGRLFNALEQARDASFLPGSTLCKPALNDLLLRLRGVV
ncbi:MAG: nucleotidyltransferase [Anaerolineae bacterium]|nr:nucleotidyltransferase [Anaerolineae bacterium]